MKNTKREAASVVAFTIKALAVGIIASAVLGGGVAFAKQQGFERLFLAYMMPVGTGGVATNTATSTVGTTEVECVTDDIPNTAAARNDSNPAFYTVTNRHASQLLCVFNVDYNGATDCNTTCAAETRTCDGTASTMAQPVPPNFGQRDFTFTTDQCVCVVGAAAGTDFTCERVVP